MRRTKLLISPPPHLPTSSSPHLLISSSRIDFPDIPVGIHFSIFSWDDFFQKFDDSGLAFLYLDETSDGKQSRFNKFVSREKVAETGEPDKSDVD